MESKVLDTVVDHESEVADGYVELLGRRFYRIDEYDRMAPFFMTVVGAGDAWLFVSSTGGLTAGRVAPDSALFPYYTDDKVAESAGRTGGLSVRVARCTRTWPAPPWSSRRSGQTWACGCASPGRPGPGSGSCAAAS